MKWTIAAVALIAAQAAEAAPPPACMTRSQVNEATLFMLPILLDAVAEKCRPSLPAGAYLLNGGHALSQRLAASSAEHWPGARAALESFGKGKMPEGLSGETTRGIVREMVAAEALKKVTAADCGRIDEAAETLSPLPPQNIGRLVALLIQIGADGKGKPPIICP